MIPHTWALVLAGGEGRRLQGMTTTSSGVAIPKQYCALTGNTSMLQETMQRAERIAPRERIVVIVAAQHDDWWRKSLRGFPRENVIAQPRGRGTGIGILLPLLEILNRDPDANIVLLPSDHYIRNERVIRQGIQRALNHLARGSSAMALLGIAPDRFDSGLGYIVPGAANPDGSFEVRRFVEKPGLDQSRDLLATSAVWNSFIVALQGAAVLDLFVDRFPDVVTAMIHALQTESVLQDGSLARLYDALPEIDFSRHVVAGAERRLSVIPVRNSGWSDLGTPERVAECLAGLSSAGIRRERATHGAPTAFLRLADTQLQFAG